MREWRGEEPDRAEGNAAADAADAADQLRRAVEQERHRAAARRFFDAAPLYRVDFEEDGTVSLRKKSYEFWPDRPPAACTRWRVLSTHPDLEGAERRLRHIASPPVYYDERGRLAPAPAAAERERRRPTGPDDAPG
ncbi:hypothetical protein GCM10009416_17850 [Craurococcus roseus]|uniref:Lipoprotein n=1 Tax=Craurococcus roseus TaxID=77585 RepID=A0ABN1F1G3_9PROT